MAAAFATLCANHINAYVQALLDVLWMADHVHVQNTGLVKSFNHIFGRNAHSRHEKLGAAINDYADEFIKLAFSVIIASSPGPVSDCGE